MSVTGFLVNNEVQKYDYESLENYNTPDFSTSSTYQVGDYVMYQGKLYKCTTAITTGGAWDSTKWSLAILSDDVANLKNALNNLNDEFEIDTTTALDLSTPVSHATVINGLSGKYSSGSGRRTNFYTRPVGEEKITVKANDDYSAYFSFLTSDTAYANYDIPYCTNTTENILSAGQTGTYDIPDDCTYISFRITSSGHTYRPASVVFPNSEYTDKLLILPDKAADAKATGDKISEVVENIDGRFQRCGANYSLSTDANYYVDKVPSYFIKPPATPTSFDEVKGYLDNKIESIPKDGKSFIFITDTHWDGNEKHSPEIIAYIRERTGINKVLFGGDVFGNATNKYLAAKKASGYLLPSKRMYGYDFLPCVGDHDNNTVSVPSDDTHWLPYAQIEELFMSNLERHPSYHWYDCREKLADFATVGSDDYNEAVSFFHTVYYVDDEILKIRYISLNCGNAGNYGGMYNIFGGSGTELLRLQFDWLADTMMSTPSGWDIVLHSHKGNGGNGGVAADIFNVIVYNFRVKNSNASGNPSSSTAAIERWWPHNWSYNFGNAPDVRYIIAINGHEHMDRLMVWGKTSGTFSKDPSYVTSGSTINQPNTGTPDNVQIPLIVTNCDSLGVISSYSPTMTAGTVTEQCFDVFTITDTGLVITRIGAGNDRSLTITRDAT